MIRKVESLQHPFIKHFVRLRQDKDYRIEHQSVIISGKKMIEEVCIQHHAKMLMTIDKSLIPHDIIVDEVVLVNEAIIQKVTGMSTSEGMVAEVFMPKPANLLGMHYIFACDCISDPANLGALLRSGLALGWEGAFILNTSCDPYNDKALRVAKGATFRLPITMGTWDDLKKIIHQNNLQPVAADIAGSPLPAVKAPDKILLVLGNEAHGLSTEAQRICKKVTIPMPGEMESLNVAIAGSILMYVLKNP